MVDLPKVKKDPVNPTKTSHSKLDWNKLPAVFKCSSFDSTVKMLELNTDNKITFVVEMVKANLLLTMFEPINSKLVFTAGLNELDLIKLKLPTKEKLKFIVEKTPSCTMIELKKDYLVKYICFMNHLMMEVFQFLDHLKVHISFILNV